MGIGIPRPDNTPKCCTSEGMVRDHAVRTRLDIPDRTTVAPACPDGTTARRNDHTAESGIRGGTKTGEELRIGGDLNVNVNKEHERTFTLIQRLLVEIHSLEVRAIRQLVPQPSSPSSPAPSLPLHPTHRSSSSSSQTYS